MVLWVLAALLVAVIYYANQYYFNYWKRLRVPQRDAPTFLFGDIADQFLGAKKSIGETFAEFYNRFKHNKIHGLYFSYRPSLILNDPEVIQEVMIKDFTSFHDRGLFVDPEVDPLGAHLFMIGGQKWRDLRVKLSPTFTSGKLKVMYPIIRDCAKTLQDYMVKNTKNVKQLEFDSRDLFARFTTNVISSVAFGIENDCINDQENVFRKMGARIFQVNLKSRILQILAFFTPKVVERLKIKQIDQEIDDFIYSIVNQTIDLREKGGSAAERKDFMQLMVQLKNQGYVSVDKNEEPELEKQKSSETKKLTIDEIAAQVFVFFAAGFETSSSTMNFCMYELSKNPHIQKKVHEELDNIWKSGDANELTYEVLGSMKYLDWCIDEALRKYPIVPILNRESSKDHQFSGTNMKVEKGTPITIPVLGIQRDPAIYDSPMEFRPERFENSSTGSPNVKGLCYMPFGDGPRNCIGARMGKLQTKIGLAAILKKFKFELADQARNELEFDPGQFVLTPKTNVMLRAMARDLSEYMCENGQPPTFVPHKPVTGVIGASFSVVSIMVANILRLFKIPQISYASTSTELSDKSRFEYFSRVVPPDNFQAQAMVEILKTLGWRYVSTVAVEGDYGEKGIASFISIAHDLGICVAVSEKVSRHSKPNDFDRIIERLSQKPQARAVVMFVDEDNTRKLLLASIRANKTGHFFWVGSDSWGAKVHPVRDHEYAAVNAITVLPHRTSLVGFDEYYARLKPTLDRKHCTEFGVNIPYGDSNGFRLNCRNIWFNEYWSQHHRCSLNRNDENACTGNETMGPYEQEGLVPFVVDAVFAMAHALDELYKDVCGGIPYNDCAEMNSASIGPRLLKYILKVSFVGRQGSLIHFNKDGDAYGSYNIYQYQQKDSKYDYVPIGTWKEGLNLSMAELKWHNGIVPQSLCSGPCPAGHVKNHQDQCCWSCLRCREDSYVDNDTCITCPPGWAPNENKTDCDKLTPQVIDWKSPWALVPLIFAAIGIGCTVFTVCVFIKFNKTPVIMASGRELCYVLLLGILSSYGMTFLILSEPTVKRCAAVRVGLGLCLSLCYSAIFIKTNRISRIFNRGVKTVHRPTYTSPFSQVAICLGIALVNVVGTIVWLIYEEPDVREVYPSPLTAVLSCKVSEISLVLSLMFNMLLILLCTLYAFKTRKIPENYNEAKYIAFTMYSTCIVWLAFLPIYFSTKNDYRIQMSCLCTCLMISASVPLGCLFVPKVYLVLFQPYKNVRQTNGKKVGETKGGKYSMQHSVTKVQVDQSTTTVSRTSPRFDQQTNDEIDVYVLDPSLEMKNLQ